MQAHGEGGREKRSKKRAQKGANSLLGQGALAPVPAATHLLLCRCRGRLARCCPCCLRLAGQPVHHHIDVDALPALPHVINHAPHLGAGQERGWRHPGRKGVREGGWHRRAGQAHQTCHGAPINASNCRGPARGMLQLHATTRKRSQAQCPQAHIVAGEAHDRDVVNQLLQRHALGARGELLQKKRGCRRQAQWLKEASHPLLHSNQPNNRSPSVRQLPARLNH